MLPSGTRFLSFFAVTSFLISSAILFGDRPDTGGGLRSAVISVPQHLASPAEPTPEPTPPTEETEAAPVGPLQDAAAAMLSDRPSCAIVRRDGRTMVAHNPDIPLTTASTQKVLVAAAALEVLGPDHRFRTKVRAMETGETGEVGHVWLAGGGDPLLSTPEYASYLAHNLRWKDTPPTPLSALADNLVASGIRHIHGSIHADETRHELKRLVADWQPPLLRGGSISPLSALTVNGGWSTWAPHKAPLANPGWDAAGELTRLLRERGVIVAGEPAVGPTPPDTHHLTDVYSAPLSKIAMGLLRASDNMATEMLTREVGRKHAGEATTEAGLRSVRQILAAMGVDVRGFGLVDGSGLSWSNHATCRTLVEAVELAPGGVRMADLLAVAGRNGTLYRRFVGTPLEGKLLGKTGSVTAVTGLTGELGDGRTTYAILQNGVPDPGEARMREEHLLTMVSQHL